MNITDGALTGLDFIGNSLTCEEFVLAGEQFDPDDYEKKGEGWRLELVTETEDQVDIDGKLKIGYALLTGHPADLVVDKRIVVPNMTVAGVKFEDHFSLSETYTHLLKDVTVSGGHFFSIAGWSFTRHGESLKLDAPDGLWARVLHNRAPPSADLAYAERLGAQTVSGRWWTPLWKVNNIEKFKHMEPR